ncbi:hypothetical protein SS1G_03596 [Sclerotinia sclerotiorum 1980 UF-70]|uniref:Rhodopsin domain-containing protein n=2 Tax=Sclerotinia sclerotiorum (strain ATCC 18683 / 1980 / Ss-1) TaxID=665079 RepID=A7EE56_SCLS1|nr:hypothetical protein SS1G_03596 [Sclerotinia sclerotiorum 1980 UF-70]APA10777.1 hypothetical protein sscle_07g055470 [Sclerotinia sclerotiorum 1980 UF-70]EDO01122.1 hypothetical protein SS1G_03596 [Sclerotinia sclerotiorum 1980 UF-70]
MAASAVPNPYKLGLNQVGYATLVVSILFILVSTIAAVLRIWTRIVKSAKFGIDDWLLFVSVFLFYAFCANILVGVYTLGGGQVYTDLVVLSRKSQQYLKSEYAIPPIYATNVTTVKLSILFFYRRIFETPCFLRNNTIVMVVCCIWYVANLIGDLLYCIPMATFWNPAVKGSCFNFSLYFLIMELFDMLLDIAILCLPTKMILGLHLPLKNRIGILGIFLLGALVVITSAIRIGYLYNPSEVVLSLARASLWSVINLGVAILCACLPTYKPLFSRFYTISSSLWSSSLWSRHNRSRNTDESANKTAGDANSHPAAYYYRMGDSNEDSTGDTVYHTGVSTQIRSISEGQVIPMDGVLVQRDVDMNRSSAVTGGNEISKV